jgi:hypothetical protein
MFYIFLKRQGNLKLIQVKVNFLGLFSISYEFFKNILRVFPNDEWTPFWMVGVISKNNQMRVLMWSNKDLNTLKRRFLIWSNKDPKIEVTHAQIQILNALCLKSIWVQKKLAIKNSNIVVAKWVWYKLYYFQKCQNFEKVWTRYSEIFGGKKSKRKLM